MSGVILEGFILPPDKSILHRLLILGSLSNAEIEIPLHSPTLPEDVEATIACLRALGVDVVRSATTLHFQGVGLSGWKTPGRALNCHNSGTTARLLTGALCGQSVTATLTGDGSLSKRPMKRLVNLLNKYFGARVEVIGTDGLPLMVYGTSLHPAKVLTPVASAQLKSALLLAALQTTGVTIISEPGPSRDHTERMLQSFGVEVTSSGNTIEIRSERLVPISGKIEYVVPLDISAAYYLIVAAVLENKAIKLSNILLNPTRTRFLDILCATFINIEIANRQEQWNEPRGDITVSPVDVRSLSLHLTPEDIPLIIDELPLIAVLAALFTGRTVVEGAGELRYKESDRLKLVVTNVKRFGLEAEETEDGFIIEGKADLMPISATIQHGGDHRIAMAFALMATKSIVTIPDPSIVNVSFPGYFAELEKIVGSGRIQFN